MLGDRDSTSRTRGRLVGRRILLNFLLNHLAAVDPLHVRWLQRLPQRFDERSRKRDRTSVQGLRLRGELRDHDLTLGVYK